MKSWKMSSVSVFFFLVGSVGAAQRADAASCVLALKSNGTPVSYANVHTDEVVAIGPVSQSFPIQVPVFELELRGPALHTTGCQLVFSEGTTDVLSINCDGEGRAEVSTRLPDALMKAGAKLDLTYELPLTVPFWERSNADSARPYARVSMEATCSK